VVAHPRRPRGHLARAPIAVLLLALVMLAVPLEATQPIHLHEAGSAGLYNEEHVLGSLDSVTGDLPLAEGRPAVFVAVVGGPGLGAGGARRSAPEGDLADSRAPPLA